jgi:hydrogenase-4 component B
MSGVMIKLGVYGLLRVGLDLLGGGPAWWGALLIGLGALSAVVGVLYALMENDLLTLLLVWGA